MSKYNFTQKEKEAIADYNTRIAVFMGCQVIRDGYYVTPKGRKYRFPNEDNEEKHRNNLRYHLSMDWLLPVIEKIESIEDDFHGRFTVHISQNSCVIQGSNLDTRPETFHPAYMNYETHDTKLLATWTAVARFVEWFKHYKLEQHDCETIV